MLRNLERLNGVREGHFGPNHPHACTEAEANFLEADYAHRSAPPISIGGLIALSNKVRVALSALYNERATNPPTTQHDGVPRAHAGAMPGPPISVDLATVQDGDTVDLPGRKVTFRVERKLRPVTAPIFLPRDLADRVRRMATGLVMDGSFEDDGGVRVTLKIEAREGWTA